MLQFMHLFMFYLSIDPSISLSIYIYLSINLSTYLSIIYHHRALGIAETGKAMHNKIILSCFIIAISEVSISKTSFAILV